MLGSVKNELPIELVNAVLLALFAVLPVLIVGFTWQSLLALRIRPVFSLHRFSRTEWIERRSSIRTFAAD